MPKRQARTAGVEGEDRDRDAVLIRAERHRAALGLAIDPSLPIVRAFGFRSGPTGTVSPLMQRLGHLPTAAAAVEAEAVEAACVAQWASRSVRFPPIDAVGEQFTELTLSPAAPAASQKQPQHQEESLRDAAAVAARRRARDAFAEDATSMEGGGEAHSIIDEIASTIQSLEAFSSHATTESFRLMAPFFEAFQVGSRLRVWSSCSAGCPALSPKACAASHFCRSRAAARPPLLYLTTTIALHTFALHFSTHTRLIFLLAATVAILRFRAKKFTAQVDSNSCTAVACLRAAAFRTTPSLRVRPKR